MRAHRNIVFEPVSAFIGLTALLTEAGFAAGTAAWLGGTMLTLGASLALAGISMALSSRGGASANSPDVRFNERQSVPAIRKIYGRARVGGALFFEEVKPPYLYMGILLSHGEIDGIDALYIGANNAGLPYFTDGVAIAAPHQVKTAASATSEGALIPATFDYYGYLWASFGYGTSGQPRDVLLGADFANIATDFRQQGIARAVFKFRWGDNQDDYTRVWGQVQRPSPYLDVRGAKVYDPRDSTQALADPATWRFSTNAVLVIADYLMADFGGRLDPARIDWERIAEEADWADGRVGCADGTTLTRYTIDGVVTMTQSPADIIQQMGSAIGCIDRSPVVERGGKMWVSARKPKSSVLTIHDGLLAGGFKFRDAKPKREKFNRIRTRFASREREYQIVDGPVYDRPDLQEIDGELLETTISLPFTSDHRAVQRIAKAYLEESRIGRALECRTDIAALALAQDELIDAAVTVNSNLFAVINGSYRVRKMTLDLPFVDFTLEQYDSSIETGWDPAEDEQEFKLETINVS